MKVMNKQIDDINLMEGRAEYDTDYQVGQDNIKILGLDVHNVVFSISAGFILLFILGTLLFQDSAKQVLSGARSWSIENFDWLFMIGCNLFVVFCLVLIVSPFGKIRLGGIGAKRNNFV